MSKPPVWNAASSGMESMRDICVSSLRATLSYIQMRTSSLRGCREAVSDMAYMMYSGAGSRRGRTVTLIVRPGATGIVMGGRRANRRGPVVQRSSSSSPASSTSMSSTRDHIFLGDGLWAEAAGERPSGRRIVVSDFSVFTIVLRVSLAPVSSWQHFTMHGSSRGRTFYDQKCDREYDSHLHPP